MDRAIAVLDPACFSIVMATGIVSLACLQASETGATLRLFGQALFWINAPLFLLLLVLTGIRCLRHFRPLAADLSDHRRAFGFFSTVAASSVLGGQFLQIAKMPSVAVTLWLLSLSLWFVMTYAIFTCITIKPDFFNGNCNLIKIAQPSHSGCTRRRTKRGK